jgi:hypothetical protein
MGGESNMKNKFKIRDIVKVKGLTGIKYNSIGNTYRKLLKNLQTEIIGKIGRIDKIEKDSDFKKNLIRIIIIDKFDYSYRRFPLSLFENELANVTEKERRIFLRLEHGYMAYDLARKL